MICNNRSLFQASTPSVETPSSQITPNTETDIQIACNIENPTENGASLTQIGDLTNEVACVVKSDEGTKCKPDDNESK